MFKQFSNVNGTIKDINSHKHISNIKNNATTTLRKGNTGIAKQPLIENTNTLSTFAITTNDSNIIPIYSNNLTNVLINDCLKITALIDTGASTSVLSAKTLETLRSRGQKCQLYDCKGIRLSAISGTQLNVLGRVFLRVHIGKCLLRVPAYVVTNMHNNFVIGNDVMKKYKMVIDYDSDKLLIKAENVYVLEQVVIPPKSRATIRVKPKIHTLIPGVVGRLELHINMGKLGLTGEHKITTLPINSILTYTAFNGNDFSVCLKRNACLGTFRALNKKFKEKYKQSVSGTLQVNNSNMTQNNSENNNVPDALYDSFAEQNLAISIAGINNENNVTIKPLEFNISNNNLTNEEKLNLNELLNKNRHVFATHPHDLGEFNGREFKIELKPDAKPVKSLPHRASPKQRQIIDEEVEKLLQAGVIEPCHSEYSSPVVLVPKEYDDKGKVTSHRLAIDYRGLNKSIKQSNYGLPNITDFLDSLGGAQGRRIRYYTTLDCVQGYLQIKVHEQSRDYTAFVTHSGMYRYKRLPFGISTAPAQFMSIMNDLFRKYLYKSVLIYLDDIICFSETLEEHLQLLQEIFDILHKANLKLKAVKCKFAVDKVKYLGHIVSSEGLKPDDTKLQAIKDYPPPKNLKQVRAFVGLCSYYRRFVPNFSKYSSCLTNLTRKDTPFVWSPECQKNFEILKEKLLNYPIVAFPRYDEPFQIFTDASGSSLSAILTQIQDGHERLISCVGRNVLPAESRYSTHEKESLAIFYAFKKFDSYIRYTHVDVITDCKSLCEILKKRPVSPRISKWVYYLASYDFDVIYRAGAFNHADGLSRIKYPYDVRPEEIEPPIEPYLDAVTLQHAAREQMNEPYAAGGNHSCVDNSLQFNGHTQLITASQPFNTAQRAIETVNEILVDQSTEESMNGPTNNDSSRLQEPHTHKIAIPYGTKLTLDIIHNEQLLDLKLRPIIDYLNNDLLPENDKLARKVVLQSANYNYTDNLLYHQQASRAKNINQLNIQLVIPENLKLTVLKEHHDNIGHRGIVNTFHSIKQNYFWNNMYKDCHHYVQSCTVCMQHKQMQKKDRCPLNPIPVANSPFRHWFTDLVGPLKTTKHGHSYIFTCVDSFSKLVEIVPLRDITAYTVAKALFENIICRYGCFERISSDRGTQYTSALFAHLVSMCNSQHILAASAHHAGVGQVERENQSIERILAKYVNFDRNNWDEMLCLAKFAINISVNESTGVSPYIIAFGREPKLALDIALRKPERIQRSMENELEDLINKITMLDKIVKDNVDYSKNNMKKYYDKNSKPLTYKIGQLVWLYLFQLPKNMSGKFQTSWYGPYRIIAKEGYNFKLRRVEDNTILPVAVHPDRLQPFYNRNILPPIPPTPPPHMTDLEEERMNDSALGSNLSNKTDDSTNQPSMITKQSKTKAEPRSSTDLMPKSLTLDTAQSMLQNHQPHTDVNSQDQSKQTPSLPHPNVTEHSPERTVFSVPKARKGKDFVEYYIIYNDQINKKVGEYIPECNLTDTEKNFIEQNKDKIRFMRKIPKPNLELNQIDKSLNYYFDLQL